LVFLHKEIPKRKNFAMTRSFLLSLVLFICLFVSAQDTAENKYLLTTKSATYGISVCNFTDPYLSPAKYSGNGLNYVLESRKLLSTKNTNYSVQTKFRIAANVMLNPSRSSEMLYSGLNYGWGLSYHFRLNPGLQIFAGGLCDLDFGFKDIPRNINNPVNLDLATNLNLTGFIMYKLPLRKRILHLSAAFQSPLIGYMYVPDAGATYYEMFELGNLSNVFHVSSVFNKIGLNQSYSVDIPCNKNTWRLGVNIQNLKYKANNLVFNHQEVSFSIGSTFDVIKFGGRKRIPPQNFINAYE
jgi:Protein of unknown function (DUF3316).